MVLLNISLYYSKAHTAPRSPKNELTQLAHTLSLLKTAEDTTHVDCDTVYLGEVTGGIASTDVIAARGNSSLLAALCVVPLIYNGKYFIKYNGYCLR